ncbi:hypothetical protein Tco_1531909 [Tanacetum coccineum]
MKTSKLPSLIGIRSISKGWFNKVSIVMGGIFNIEARDMDTKLLIRSRNQIITLADQIVKICLPSSGPQFGEQYFAISLSKGFLNSSPVKVHHSKSNFTLQYPVQLLQENTDSVRSNQEIRASLGLVVLSLFIPCCDGLCFQSYENTIRQQLLDGQSRVRAFDASDVDSSFREAFY